MDIIISNSGGVPIYDQITRQIKGLILRGELREGEALPSMRLLAKELRISVITTKRAYEELERDGFITTVPGKGCFDGEIVLFDLEQGYVRRKGEKTPKITPLQTDDVLRQYPKVSEFIQSYQQLAIAERASEAGSSSREGIVETTYRDVSEEAHAACG